MKEVASTKRVSNRHCLQAKPSSSLNKPLTLVERTAQVKLTCSIMEQDSSLLSRQTQLKQQTSQLHTSRTSLSAWINNSLSSKDSKWLKLPWTFSRHSWATITMKSNITRWMQRQLRLIFILASTRNLKTIKLWEWPSQIRNSNTSNNGTHLNIIRVTSNGNNRHQFKRKFKDRPLSTRLRRKSTNSDRIRKLEKDAQT